MWKTEKFAKYSSTILDNLVVAAKMEQFPKILPKEKTWLMYQSWPILQDWALLDMFRQVPTCFCRIWARNLNIFLLHHPLTRENRSFLIELLSDLGKKLISVAVGQNLLVVLVIGHVKTCSRLKNLTLLGLTIPRVGKFVFVTLFTRFQFNGQNVIFGMAVRGSKTVQQFGYCPP